MKKIIYSLKSFIVLALILVISVSCDNDFSNIQSDIEGIKNFNATSKLFPITTETKLFTPFTASGTNDAVGVQTNNAPGTLLGVYKDPNDVFGTMEASLTTQLVPITNNPDFGTNPVIESVILNIPYFSTLEDTDTDTGESTYTLDSIFGDTNIEYKLSIYRNNYVLRDLNPEADFETTQCYYSNQQGLFDDTTSSMDLIYEDTEFKPSENEIEIPGEIDPETMEQEDSTFLPPAIRIEFKDDPMTSNVVNPTFWEDLLFNNATPNDFSNQNLFTNYFRGLIFKVEATSAESNGSIFYLNMAGGSILVDYTNQEEIDNPEDFEDVITTTAYRLEFNGNSVNTFNTVGNNTDVDGDQDNLYLKGGDGSFVLIDLFAGDIINDEGETQDALDYFISKKDKWLINEVNLIFYVNQDLVNGAEPDRVILYDLESNIPIADYFLDGIVSTTNPSSSRTMFSEPLERDDSGDGVRYKFTITNHINGILNNEETNVKLGLYLTYNINQTTDAFGDLISSKIQGVSTDEDDSTIDLLPPASILSPKGTILHGGDSTINPNIKAPEFEIFYTDPEN